MHLCRHYNTDTTVEFPQKTQTGKSDILEHHDSSNHRFGRVRMEGCCEGEGASTPKCLLEKLSFRANCEEGQDCFHLGVPN